MRVKLNWIELLTVLPIIGILVGLIGILIGLLMPVGDFDLKHRYQPLASRHGPYYVRRLFVVSVADHSCVADEGSPYSSERPLEPGTPVVAVVAEEEGRPR
jgi:hypothetical protein